MESHLSLLDSVVRSAERWYEDERSCLEHRKKASALCLVYKICHRAGLPLHEYLSNFVSACNNKASAALCELALVIQN